MHDYLQEVKELIILDELADALDLFFAREQRQGLVNEIILMKSGFLALQKRIRAGTLSFDEETLATNKVRFDLLELIAKAAVDEDPGGFTGDQRFSFDHEVIDQHIRKLTDDQFKVLNFIHKMKRVRISGSAGSGKTLVAAEKAIRLDKEGKSVLFLCHNPNLAGRAKDLVSGTRVFVIPFGQFIRNLTEYGSLQQIGWNKFHEPLPEELNRGLDLIETKKLGFDAIIVDEAQDFREDWWLITEALLANGKDQILYIFHDDNQALLPDRSVYPFEEPLVDLSKNCRNAGKIHEFIRANFHHQAPDSSPEIREMGRVKAFVYTHSEHLHQKVFAALEWMGSYGQIKDPVILLAGDLTTESWEFGSVTRTIPAGAGWKQELENHLSKLAPDLLNSPKWAKIRNRALPDAEEVKIISELANEAFDQLDKSAIIALLGTRVAGSKQVHWKVDNGKSSMHFPHEDAPIQQYFLLKFLSDPQWASGLQKTLTYHFRQELYKEEPTIPVLETSSFKGLEAEGVVLVSRGQSFAHLNELYVASSRARKLLALVIDKANEQFYIP